MTIRRRLLLLLLPALALLMLAGALADRWVAEASTQAAYDQALASAALAAAAYVRIDRQTVDSAALARTLGFLRDVDDPPDNLHADGPDSRYLAVSAPDGTPLAGSPELAALRAPAQAGRPTFRNAIFEGRAVRLVTLAVPSAGGALTVTLAETRQRREHTERIMLFGKLLVDFAELDLILLVTWIAVHLGLQPLGRLREQAEMQSHRELNRFDPAGVPGELRPVVAAFNRVLELLHGAASAQQRFVADAAHQLRTPVAGLSAQIELLLTEPRAAPVAMELGILQRGAQSLARSANQLLALARAEPVAAHGQLQMVALDALVRELVERHLDQAVKVGIDLGAEAGEASVRGYLWPLQDLLGNLIDNAIKYTPRGGHVTVRSGIDPQEVWLEVEDDGPGIPPEERQRVRDRFYRRPGSSAAGAGLGLAIVEEICRLHGARLTIDSGSEGRGARLRVHFVRASSTGDLSVDIM